MRSKKILAGVLTLMFIFGGSVLPESFTGADTAITACAEVYGDFEYKIKDGTIEITKYKGSDKEVTIPAEIDGKAVTRIGSTAFFNSSTLINIEIPDSVTRIDGYAFAGCSLLTSVTIPNSVKSIELCAFCRCTRLKSVTLPDGITRIDQEMFNDCPSLTRITIPKSVTWIGYKAFGYYKTPKDGKIVSEKVDGFKIKCYKDTAGEKYAKENGFDYELITDSKLSNGEISGDGIIDIEDAVMIIGNINGAKSLTDEQQKYADVDDSGKVDIEDAVAIISHVNGIKAIK